MGKQLSEIVKKLLKKHINSQVYIVLSNKKEIISEHGLLKEIDDSKIVIDSYTNSIKNRSLKFFDSEGFHIRHIYNANFLDIFDTEQTNVLAYKLRDKNNRKWIINNLKTSLNETVFVISKQNYALTVLKGRLDDMGIMGLKVKIPPYYNREETLEYNTIFNVYNENLTDLTK